ncbi:MAG: FAD-dependent oxidoreductase [Actinomycetaceae bacterium]|nr:FAD-dependent oxidoreductase [Actinomycetaceae bacterium]
MRLVVVGGVAGGMGAAARYRRLDEDAEIIVLDRGDYVSYANCALPYHVGGQVPRAAQLVVQTPETLKGALDLDIRLRHNVVGINAEAQTITVETVGGTEKIDYDELILAPGANAFVPPIPGIDSPRVSTLRTVDDAVTMAETVDAGAKRAVILGAGFIGLEAAESLAIRGLEVSVVELSDHILPPVEPEIALVIREELERAGLHIYEGISATAIEPGDESDAVVLSNGERIEADLIVLSAGVRPATEAFERDGVECERGAIVVDEHGRTSLPHVWAVGDATLSVDAVTGTRRVVALAGPAARAGRYVADAIYNIETARPIPPALGTAIVSVGTQGAGMTGANSRALDAAGIDYHTIHLHPYQHVSWFPGAEEMHMVVFFAKEDGRILGAQAVGRDGVDKRIDLFAQAIREGKSIVDMIDLDLTYSPQFGMPKDPVIMAGLIGDNVLNGNLKLWYANELPSAMENDFILDVRRPDEFEMGHIKGAMNISHDTLREHIDEVRAAAAGRHVRLVCQSGLRSYIAHRVLSAQGIESSSLDGGMLSLRQVLGSELATVLNKS